MIMQTVKAYVHRSCITSATDVVFFAAGEEDAMTLSISGRTHDVA